MNNLSEAFNILITKGEFIYSLTGNVHDRYLMIIDHITIKIENETSFKYCLVDFIFHTSHHLGDDNIFIVGRYEKDVSDKWCEIFITKSYPTLNLITNKGCILDTETNKVIAPKALIESISHDVDDLFKSGIKAVIGNIRWHELSRCKQILKDSIKSGKMSHDIDEVVLLITHIEKVASWYLWEPLGGTI